MKLQRRGKHVFYYGDSSLPGLSPRARYAQNTNGKARSRAGSRRVFSSQMILYKFDCGR